MEEVIKQLAGTGLSEKQLKAVACLVIEDSKVAAARRIGVDVSTIHRWLAKPAFRQAVTDARQALLADLFAEVRGQAEALVRK
ncbi:MAG: hypothetical protein BroJett011_33900 [Chloroflexota bacterium]|nr:MAG: hypothetical protein BroJett011_33900 [Chloroflexota bacterium]